LCILALVVKFRDAIDRYIADQRSQGRINSDATEVGYRACLNRHADVVGNRDPRYTSRDDVKRTLAHWTHPNTYRINRSILKSFYTWCEEEGLRKDNPARQTRRPKRRPVSIYRLTGEEAVRMLKAAQGVRERRAIFLGICAGLRNSELRGLQGRHFERKDVIWVSADIGPPGTVCAGDGGA
jgi:integrase